jgi:integrase
LRNTTAIKDIEYHLTKEQVESIAQYFKESFLSLPKGKIKHSYLKCYYLTLILFYTGRRISEIIGQKPYTRLKGLCEEDINTTENRIRFYIAKKNTIRAYKRVEMKTQIIYKRMNETELATLKAEKQPYTFFMPVKKEVIELLQKAIQYFKPLPNRRIIKINRNTFDIKLKEATKKLGIKVTGTRRVRLLESREYKYDDRGLIIIQHNSPLYKYNWKYEQQPRNIGVHILRHSFSMEFIKKNKDDPLVLQKLQKILCHSNISITQAYLTATNEELRQNIEKL